MLWCPTSVVKDALKKKKILYSIFFFLNYVFNSEESGCILYMSAHTMVRPCSLKNDTQKIKVFFKVDELIRGDWEFFL